MGTIRRNAVSLLDRIKVDAHVLRTHIDCEEDVSPSVEMLTNYEGYARHLRANLDRLDAELAKLKALI